MMNYYGYGDGSWGGMMGSWGWLMSLTWIVWLVVGILLVVWLWQKVRK